MNELDETRALEAASRLLTWPNDKPRPSEAALAAYLARINWSKPTTDILDCRRVVFDTLTECGHTKYAAMVINGDCDDLSEMVIARNAYAAALERANPEINIMKFVRDIASYRASKNNEHTLAANIILGNLDDSENVQIIYKAYTAALERTKV